MSAPAPTARAPQDETRTLDLLAQRLQHLNGAIEVLKNTQLQHSWDIQPPPWQTISHQSNIINGRLLALLGVFDDNKELLNRAHAYPLPTFPGRSHEIMATQLTRKKLEPWVEDWIADGVKHAAGSDGDMNENGKLPGHGGLTGDQIEQLWDWAGPAGGNIGREIMTAEDDDEDDDEDDEEEEEEEEVEGVMDGIETSGSASKGEAVAPAQPMMKLDKILKFVSTGALVA
ncbi:mediator complex, subunit Med8 [Phyllosticta citriasiana]|uniref:Mediator of RNA polymerase II transcription subunit 8 n=1 Tax=Phyllosticta citriasiana TaxID=595635 RepID=A0ABR1KUJ5_9PEZI